MFVSNKNESVQMFENPILEYFSHIHPATPHVVFLPVVVWMTYLSTTTTHVLWTIGLWLSGLLFWTLFEYILHRWAFHYQPTSRFGKYFHFLIHGVHHDYPRDATRLVMPLLASIPIALMIYWLMTLMMSEYTYGFFAGFIFGYVCYDTIHYLSHHGKNTSRIARIIKKHHMNHHYVSHNANYGVSSPLWDIIFRTVEKEHNIHE